MSARPQRLIFGEVAELYDASRPGYPEGLIDDLVAWAGQPPRALEVGAGTGKALRAVAERGVEVVAIEPSVEMAAVARRTTAQWKVTIVESDFETSDPPGAPFGLIYAAQSWHWVDQARGLTHARELLTAGGRLACFWNRPVWTDSPLRQPLAQAYATAVPTLAVDNPMHPMSQAVFDRDVDWDAGIAATDGLADPEIRQYPWQLSYSADGFVDLLATLSEIRLLSPARRQQLLDAVHAVIDDQGGQFVLPMRTRLCLARAV